MTRDSDVDSVSFGPMRLDDVPAESDCSSAPAASRWDQLSPNNAKLIRGWAPMAFVPSPALANALGVRVARLRTWRARNRGPAWEPRQGSNPAMTFYRCSAVWAWLDCRPPDEAWTYERDWILERFRGATFGSVTVSESLSRAETEAVSAAMLGLMRFPEFCQLARVRALPSPQPRKTPNYSLTASLRTLQLEGATG